MSTDRGTRVPAELPDVVAGAVLAHATRGLRIQVRLRFALVVFVAATLAAAPPATGVAASWVVAVAYAAAAVALALWVRRGGPAPVRLGWLGLFVDLAVLSTVTLIAGASAQTSWTADVLVNGFFLVPMLAATQLRPGVCASVSGATAVLYLGVSLGTRAANEEPLASVLLRSAAMAAVAAGAVALSAVQRSRVATISAMVAERARLSAELVGVEARERQVLAEDLHDGALQYVLAARHDLEDVRAGTDPEGVDRVDRALVESARLLRGTTSQLHPAVLAGAGLARALRELGAGLGARGGFTCSVDAEHWPDDLRTTGDTLLFTSARELLTNVAKHALATRVSVDLSRTDERARLVVTDDGVGLGPAAAGDSAASGHIGLASYRIRLAAAGGSLAVGPGPGAGTRAEVELPCLAV